MSWIHINFEAPSYQDWNPGTAGTSSFNKLRTEFQSWLSRRMSILKLKNRFVQTVSSSLLCILNLHRCTGSLWRTVPWSALRFSLVSCFGWLIPNLPSSKWARLAFTIREQYDVAVQVEQPISLSPMLYYLSSLVGTVHGSLMDTLDSIDWMAMVTLYFFLLQIWHFIIILVYTQGFVQYQQLV